jgi:hypothetical protein
MGQPAGRWLNGQRPRRCRTIRDKAGIMTEEARLAAARENGLHLARANFAYGRVA